LVELELGAVMGTNNDTSAERCHYKEALLTETREELQKADSKASILLAASGIAASAVLTALGAGTWTPAKLHHIDARWVSFAAMSSILVGLCFLAAAVKPRMRAKAMDKTRLHYFGNVRAYWPTSSVWSKRQTKRRELQDMRLSFNKALNAASNDANYEDRLDDQIWFLGRTAFRKYRYIAVSLWVFGGGVGLGLLTIVLEKI
jgi:hypothetical protein